MKNFKSFLIVVPVIAICGIVAFSRIPREKKEVIQSAQPLVVEKKESANEIPVETFYNNITQLIGGNDTVLSYNPKWTSKR
jgi:hypothetical protein